MTVLRITAAYATKPITVRARPANTAGGEGFVIEADGYPFEAKWFEAAAVLHALCTKGTVAAWRAYSRVISARIAA